MYPSSTTSFVNALGAVLALTSQASAYWLMTCPQRNLIGRLDPLRSPGKISAHVHTISGGNAFGFDMDYEQARTSTCSSCPIKEDLSNYWTPALYYKGKDGKFELVKQDGIGDGSSGMNIYYVQNHGGDDSAKINAFPKGFRMLAGNPFKRNFTDDFEAEAINYSCLDYSEPAPKYINEIPNKSCSNGLRAQVFFPTCWKGGDAVDSPNHRDHVAYPTSGKYDDGPCPASHPHRLPSLFFEVTWRVQDYKWNQADGHPFVFSHGDPTGYGFHGDFINGWDVPTLQNAIDTCTDPNGDLASCKAFTFFNTEVSKSCTIPNPVEEDIAGPLNKLPGCNPVSKGPEMAQKMECPADASIKSKSPMTGPIKKPKGKMPSGSAKAEGYGQFTGGGSGDYSSGDASNDVPGSDGKTDAKPPSYGGSSGSNTGGDADVKAASSGGSSEGSSSDMSTNEQKMEAMAASNEAKLAQMKAKNAASMKAMEDANAAAGSYVKKHKHRRRHHA